jgi:Domain of unknown function (DUF4145)
MYFDRNITNYQYLQSIRCFTYKCGYCSNAVASEWGYKIGAHSDGSGTHIGGIYICSSCNGPTFILDGKQIGPLPKLGNAIRFLPDNISSLYNEARNCSSSGAFTATVLCCRKILMNAAVFLGASEGMKFVEYVNFLSEKNYIPPNSIKWVDQIRVTGNIATHEIKVVDREDATKTLLFTEMMLKIIYEMPNLA